MTDTFLKFHIFDDFISIILKQKYVSVSDADVISMVATTQAPNFVFIAKLLTSKHHIILIFTPSKREKNYVQVQFVYMDAKDNI